MGEHSTLQAALKAKLDAALTVPVVSYLDEDETRLERLAAFVGIVRENISMQPHTEINPGTTAPQLQEWTWSLYVKAGGGGSRSESKGAAVDTLLELIKTALNAQRLETTAGPLSCVQEQLIGEHGTGVMYVQRWRHGYVS